MADTLFRLDGKTALVTGARGHLGQGMTRALARAGAHVIVNGRDGARLDAYADSLRAEGFAISTAVFDAHDTEAKRRFLGGLDALDIVVNNIGFMQMVSFDDLKPADFAATYAATVTSSFETVRLALPLLEAAAAKGDASVINIASMYAQVAPDRRLYDDPAKQSPFHYGPAKAAMLQLTRHLAAELGPRRIRVNALVPGAFPAAAPADFQARLGARTMLGRTGRQSEIGGPLVFLASPASSYVTGAALNVDGGWTAW